MERHKKTIFRDKRTCTMPLSSPQQPQSKGRAKEDGKVPANTNLWVDEETSVQTCNQKITGAKCSRKTNEGVIGHLFLPENRRK